MAWNRALDQVRGEIDYQRDPMGYHISKNDDEYASKTFGRIKRQQWADYKAKYPAIQQDYLDMTMNNDFTLGQVDKVQGNVDNAFNRNQANQNATLSRMGVSNTAQDDGIDKALAITHGENSVRQHGKDRQLNAIAGGNLPTLQTQTGN